jgi:hypothetical protein
MENRIKILIACFAVLLAVTAGITAFYAHSGTDNNEDPLRGDPPPTTLPLQRTPSPALTHTTFAPAVTPHGGMNIIQANIDAVNTNNLKLGEPSSAYVTITNTGDNLITKERIEISAGKDFGFLIGYRSRTFIQEFFEVIEPGDTRVIEGLFNLPQYEGVIPLEGVYDVTIKVYANDWYHIGDWNGEVFLTA